MPRPVLLLAVAAVLLAPLLAAAAAAEATALIHIKGDGAVEAVINGTVGPGLNGFRAPAPPVPATITAVVGGENVPVVYDNGTIYVTSDKQANVTITYTVNVTAVDGGLGFNISSMRVELLIDPGVVLLQLPQRLLDARQLPGGKLLLVVEGPDTIVYTVAQRPQGGATTTAAATATATATTTTRTTTTATTATTTVAKTTTTTKTATTPAGGGAPATTTTPVTRTTTQTTRTSRTAAGTATTTTAAGGAPPPLPSTASPPPQPATGAGGAATGAGGGGGGQAAYIAAAVVVAAAIVAAALLLRGRGGGGSRPGADRGPGEAGALMTRGLDDVDRLILETLERNGGEMLQSELMRATGLPKTTIWRHVRRLAEQGYIEVIREGKANRLRLRRKP